MTAIEIIERLPFEFQAVLEADPYACDIPIIIAEEGNIEREMDRQQATMTAKGAKRGIAVIVLQVVGDDDYPNLAFGPFTLRPAFQVVENLTLNRSQMGTGKSARKVARWIRDVIKALVLEGFIKDMKPDKPSIVPVPLGEEMSKTVRAYQVNFSCLEATTETQTRLQKPQISVTGSQFTITHPVSDVKIFYTLDNSLPREMNPASILYTAPVDIPDDGATVRARAYPPEDATTTFASGVSRSEIVPA